jgi:hypothetical protein
MPNSVMIADKEFIPKDNVVKLLKMASGEPTTCSACGADIWFVTMIKTGKKNPIGSDGISHYANCPKADTFRKSIHPEEKGE